MLLTTARGLTGRIIMDVNVSSAQLDGVLRLHVAFEPLMQSSRLSDVDRNPGPILSLFRIDVIAWERLERSLDRMDLV